MHYIYIYIIEAKNDKIHNVKSEAHGPWLPHLSEIATADMHLLRDIFSILSLQVMKGSSFKQFFVLKKKNVFFMHSSSSNYYFLVKGQAYAF